MKRMMIALFFIGALTGSGAIGCKNKKAHKTFGCSKQHKQNTQEKKQNTLKKASKEQTESQSYLLSTIKKNISLSKIKNAVSYQVPAWAIAVGGAGGVLVGGGTVALLIKMMSYLSEA